VTAKTEVGEGCDVGIGGLVVLANGLERLNMGGRMRHSRGGVEEKVAQEGCSDTILGASGMVESIGGGFLGISDILVIWYSY
jgi:hypothetical protein